MGLEFRDADARYREILLEPLRICASYRPKFGTIGREQEITLDRFQQLLGADPLYGWIGLDSPLMYAAHKAAGGMTSIYRQLGIGCERLVRGIVRDALGLDAAQASWGYDTVRSDEKVQRLTLDARIDRAHLADAGARERLTDWLSRASTFMDQHIEVAGAVLEVRQGYKSADAKRQNADLRFGLAAYNERYLPVVLVVSTQVSSVVVKRYRQARLLVLTGSLIGDDTRSTFAFFENVVGYSLAGFFERNASTLKAEVTSILDALLSPA